MLEIILFFSIIFNRPEFSPNSIYKISSKQKTISLIRFGIHFVDVAYNYLKIYNGNQINNIPSFKEMRGIQQVILKRGEEGKVNKEFFFFFFRKSILI